MKPDFKIVGISGKIRSGKDTLANLMMEDGYYGVSLGEIVRDHSRTLFEKSPNPIAVENMTRTSNILRKQLGPDFLYKEAVRQFTELKDSRKYKGLLMFSVRAPIEADNIIASGGKLVWVEASDEDRYKRAMDYLREGDERISFEEFKRNEESQFKPNLELPTEIQMNLDYVKSRATNILTNDSDLEHFNSKAQELIEELDSSSNI